MTKLLKKKIVIVDAILWDGTNYKEVKKLAGDLIKLDHERNELILPDFRRVVVGEWVVRKANAQFVSCTPGVFEDTYRKNVPLNQRSW